MEKIPQTETAEKKPETAEKKLNSQTKNVIEIRHNMIFPRNLDYVPFIHQMIQPMPYFTYYRPGYWPGPPNLPRYLRFREFQNNYFEEFL